MKQIGILGGTFNPIHNGHLAIAGTAKEQFHLDKVLFLPSGVPYMKKQRKVLPFDIRLEMTALAITDCPYFEVSKLEESDAALGKNTYTFETLQKLHDIDPDASYFFILGADSLYTIENWKNPTLIFGNCTLLAAVRTSSRDSMIKQAQYLREKYCASVEILEFAGIDISSTQIREKVQRKESLRGLVPERVEQYILEHELYG